MRNAQPSAKLLRALADCLDASSSIDVDALVAGRAVLKIVNQDHKPRSPKQEAQDHPVLDVSSLVGRLKDLNSRSEGESLLNGSALVRKDLERLARALGLPVSKEDNTTRLREKIIEGAIGSRLASQAVRGNAY